MSVPILGRLFGRSDGPTTPLPSSPVDAGAGSVDDATLGRVIDAAGTLVQLIGVYAHETDGRNAEDARRVAERWKRHLTMGVEHPRTSAEPPAPRAEGDRRGVALRERDWEGAARYAIEDRRNEHAYVQRTTNELRDTIWTLVQGLHEMVGAETTAGRASAGAVTQFGAAVAKADIAVVRDVALAAVAELGKLLAERQRERDQQLASLGAQIAALGAALDEARREGATDPLTGLGNRRAFDSALSHAVALHTLTQQSVCLLVLDVDDFKEVNDELGHAAGDAALQAVTHQLCSVFLRRSDLPTRIGGDEFAVLLRDTGEEEAMRLANRLTAALAETSVKIVGPPRDANIHVRLSGGIARLKPDEGGTEWYARADAAMYAAKRAGGGKVVAAAR